MMSSIRYEFIMSQIKHIRDMKENEKTKISLVYYEGCQGPCVFKICKGRNLSEVYQALMEVRHPNLTMVYDCVYENGNTYVLEEYIPGKTLAEQLKENGTFTEEETSKIMMELCEGLEVLHRHEPPIIHNDIKASNIMIREDGIVKLFDFDISRTYKEGSYKNTKLMGTHEYAAPEHYGFGQSEPCTDIYSLGVTMHEMLTGVGLDHEHNVTYQGSMAKIIQKCVEIDRKKRYASAALLKEDLEKYQKPTGHILGIVAVCLCVLLVLAIGGILFRDYLTSGKIPQNPTEGISSEEEFETGGDIASEGAIETEEIENTENDDIPEEVTEEDSGDMVDDSQTNAEENGGNIGAGNNTGTNNDVVNSETESGESSVPKQSMKVVYEIQDSFLAMNAWNDGTYLWAEEVSGNYYLRKSDGEAKWLKGVRAAYGGQLECNSYTDQMYLLLFDYDANYVYELSKDLELKLVYEDEISGKTGAFLAFYSDGTLVYDSVRRNADDWSQIEAFSHGLETFMIKDTLYSLQYVLNGSQYLYRFLEMNEDGKVVNDFPLEEDGIVFEDFQNKNPIHNNSKAVYFIGNKAGKYYVFCFNGKEFIPLKCLNDYADYQHFGYEELCVTEKGFQCYSYPHGAIVEFTFE